MYRRCSRKEPRDFPAVAVHGHTRSVNGNTAGWETKDISGDGCERKGDLTSEALGCFLKDGL